MLANQRLSGMAWLGALQMISQSQLQVNQLVGWIRQSYSKLIGRGRNDSKSWTLISQSVRSIFNALHKARLSGKGCSDGSSSSKAGIVGGNMQAHQRMIEFCVHDFARDTVLSHRLNLHLQDNAVMHSVFAKEKIERMRLIDGCREHVMKAVSKAEKAERTADQALQMGCSKESDRRAADDDSE